MPAIAWVYANRQWHQTRFIHYKEPGGGVREVESGSRYTNGHWRKFHVHEVPTTMSWDTQPTNVTHGQYHMISGWLIERDTGKGISNAPIELWLLNPNTNTWERSSYSAVTDANGNWQQQVGGYGILGTRQWEARFVPSDKQPELASTIRSNTFDVGLDTVGLLSTGISEHARCSFSWAAVPGATQYQVYNGGTLVTTVSGTSATISIAQNTQYNWRVRAINGAIQGDFSPYLYYNGGRPEIRDQGSAWVRKECVNSGCHRNDSTGWGSDFVRQGYYSAPYGGAGYVGIYDYGDWGVGNKIVNDLGRARYDNGWASAGYTKVYKRGDVGNTSCCNCYFYSGTSYVGGPRPGLVRHGATAHLCYNSWTQVNFSADMAMDIAKQRSGARNIAIYAGSSAEYMALNKHTAGPEDGDIWVLWNWNYVSQGAIAPRWWR